MANWWEDIKARKLPADYYQPRAGLGDVETPMSVQKMQTGQYFIPGIGDALDFGEGVSEMKGGNYAMGSALLAAAAVGLIPGVGDVAGKGIKAGAKGILKHGDKAADLLSKANRTMDARRPALGDLAVEHWAKNEDGGMALDFFRMADQDGILKDAQQRARASTPKAWLDPKYERGFHPASNTKLGDTNVVPKFEDAGRLGDINALDFDELLGKTLTPAYGDRTMAGGVLSGYDEVSFPPVDMHGGQAFPREAGTGAWASEIGPMNAKARIVKELIDAGEDPRMIYTTMGAQSGDFSQMMADAMTGQIGGAEISEAAKSAFDDRMVKIIGDQWPGINNPKGIDNLPGSTRWAVWQEMDRAKWRDQGFPDVGRTRLAITDRQLLDADPFDTGLSVTKPSGILNDPNVQHPTYSTQIDGEYLGDTEMVPGSIVWRDFFNKRRKAHASPASDQRAFMMNSPTITQKVDQQMVDEVHAFLEAQRQAGRLPSPSQAVPPAAHRVNTLQPESGKTGSLSSLDGPSGNSTTTGQAQQLTPAQQGAVGLSQQQNEDETLAYLRSVGAL